MHLYVLAFIDTSAGMEQLLKSKLYNISDGPQACNIKSHFKGLLYFE